MPYKKPQVAKLVNITKERSNKLAYRIRQTILRMFMEGKCISINNVAEEAMVSRQVIYSNPELKKLIDFYGRYYQQGRFPSEEDFEVMSRIPRLQLLEDEVDRLLEENNSLNLELLRLQNQLYALEHNIEE